MPYESMFARRDGPNAKATMEREDAESGSGGVGEISAKERRERVEEDIGDVVLQLR